MKFSVDREKSVEALVYIASRLPGVTRFTAGKIIYFADRDHLRRYGRPITGDRMIAMDHGPVPSFAYNVLKGEHDQLVNKAIIENTNARHPEYLADREPDLSYFSKTDLASLDWAIEHCRKLTFGQISDETHQHKAWRDAIENREMAVEDMLDGVDEEIVEDAKEFAAYGRL